MTTGRKLVIGGALIGGLIIYVAYRGATASWQYYLTVDECVSDGASLLGHRLRVSGRIVPGTLAVDGVRKRASFTLAGDKARLNVVCSGPLPSNLADGIAVVVEGRLDDTLSLHGERVLTRCAGKYQSRLPAVSASVASKAKRG